MASFQGNFMVSLFELDKYLNLLYDNESRIELLLITAMFILEQAGE